MKTQQLFIPDKIKIGFQNREDTYTKKLAYVIYYDLKGVLRKETSWNSWRDKKITPLDFTNEPTEGFVLNRGGGGGRGWHHRNEFIRVYDPRDFEFEISVENLLFILKECNCSRGKGLEGKFVYAWEGTSLVLLPASSEDYKVSKGFTQLQGKSVSSKDLILGATYLTKKQEPLIYLGRFGYYFCIEEGTNGYFPEKPIDSEKRHVFWDKDAHQWKEDKGDFLCIKHLKRISTVECETPSPEYADLVDKYNKSVHGSRVVKLFLKEDKTMKDQYTRYCYVEQTPGQFTRLYISGDHQSLEYKWYLKDGLLYKERVYWSNYKSNHNYWPSGSVVLNPSWIDPTNMDLWAELESGTKLKVDYGTFSR